MEVGHVNLDFGIHLSRYWGKTLEEAELDDVEQEKELDEVMEVVE